MKLKDVKEIDLAMQNIDKSIYNLAAIIKDLNVVPRTDLELLQECLSKVPGSTIEYSEYGDHNGLNCYFDDLLVCFWFDPKTNKVIKITGGNT
jgi:hypothetical protein